MKGFSGSWNMWVVQAICYPWILCSTCFMPSSIVDFSCWWWSRFYRSSSPAFLRPHNGPGPASANVKQPSSGIHQLRLRWQGVNQHWTSFRLIIRDRIGADFRMFFQEYRRYRAFVLPRAAHRCGERNAARRLWQDLALAIGAFQRKTRKPMTHYTGRAEQRRERSWEQHHHLIGATRPAIR